MPHRGSRPAGDPARRPARVAGVVVCGDEPGRLRCGREHALSRKGASRTGPPSGPCRRSTTPSTDRRTDDQTYPPAASPRRSRWPPSRLGAAPAATSDDPTARRQQLRRRRPSRSRWARVTLDKRARADRLALARPRTEMLFAIGAGKQVIAVDDQSELPGQRAQDRPVRLQAQRRGDRRQEPRPGGALQRHRQDRRPARRAEDPGATRARPRPPSTTRTGSSPTWAR